MSCHWPRLIGSVPWRREDNPMNTARDGCRRWGRGEARRTLRSTACQEWVAVSASFRRASHHCGEGKSRPAPGTAKAAGMLADRSATQRQRWPINRDTLPLVPLNNQLLRQRQSLPSISQLAITTPTARAQAARSGGPGHSSGSQSAQAGCFLPAHQESAGQPPRLRPEVMARPQTGPAVERQTSISSRA